MNSVVRSFLWGAGSAMSLPLGALVAINFRPGQRLQAIYMAFGSGALLNALSLELFAHITCHFANDEEKLQIILLVMSASALMGGLLFISVDKLLENSGTGSLSMVREKLRRKVVDLQMRSLAPSRVRKEIRSQITSHFFKPVIEEPQILRRMTSGITVDRLSATFTIPRTSKTEAAISPEGSLSSLSPLQASRDDSKVKLFADRASINEMPEDPNGLVAMEIGSCESNLNELNNEDTSPPPTHRPSTGNVPNPTDAWSTIPSVDKEILLGIKQKHFPDVSAIDAENIFSKIVPASVKEGTNIYEGSPQALHFIAAGSVECGCGENDLKKQRRGPYDILGESLVCGNTIPPEMLAVTLETTQLISISAEDLTDIQNKFPSIEEALRHSTAVLKSYSNPVPLEKSISLAVEPINLHSAIMIWVGILIDAVPESLVIGFIVTDGSRNPLVLVMGVFLANFPEALSSTSMMKSAGISNFRVLSMWLATTLITGIGAAIGSSIIGGNESGCDDDDHRRLSEGGSDDDCGFEFEIFKAAVQAVAAGSMLAMIVQTMIPEACHHGGDVVGIVTLCGFLAALLSTLIPID